MWIKSRNNRLKHWLFFSFLSLFFFFKRFFFYKRFETVVHDTFILCFVSKKKNETDWNKMNPPFSFFLLRWCVFLLFQEALLMRCFLALQWGVPFREGSQHLFFFRRQYLEKCKEEASHCEGSFEKEKGNKKEDSEK